MFWRLIELKCIIKRYCLRFFVALTNELTELMSRHSTALLLTKFLSVALEVFISSNSDLKQIL